MQQSIYYIKFALQFADMQITELVNIFNRQVGNRGWTSMRAYHDQALIGEFQRRGKDTFLQPDIQIWVSDSEIIHRRCRRAASTASWRLAWSLKIGVYLSEIVDAYKCPMVSSSYLFIGCRAV